MERKVKNTIAVILLGGTIYQGSRAVSVLPPQDTDNHLDETNILDIGAPGNPLFDAGIVIADEYPSSSERQERIMDFTIKNFIRTLASMNYSGFSLEIEIIDSYGEKHHFYCMPKREACLWYPPENKEGGKIWYPSAGDISLENLNVYIGTGSIIRLLPPPENPGKSVRINWEEFENVLDNAFGNIELNLQDEGYLEWGYLKEGAMFKVENPYTFPLLYSSA